MANDLKITVGYTRLDSPPRHCAFKVAGKDFAGLSDKQTWDRFIGPAEAVLINGQ